MYLNSEHFELYNAIRREQKVNPAFGDIIIKSPGPQKIIDLRVLKAKSPALRHFFRAFVPVIESGPIDVVDQMAKILAEEVDTDIEADLRDQVRRQLLAEADQLKKHRQRMEEENYKKLKEYYSEDGSPLKSHFVVLMVRKGFHDLSEITSFTGMGFAFYHDREWPCLVRRRDNAKFPLRGDIYQYIVMYCDPFPKDPDAIHGRSFRGILTQEEFDRDLKVVARENRTIFICHKKSVTREDLQITLTELDGSYRPTIPLLKVRQIDRIPSVNSVKLFLPSEHEKAIGFALKFDLIGVKIETVSASPEEVIA